MDGTDAPPGRSDAHGDLAETRSGKRGGASELAGRIEELIDRGLLSPGQRLIEADLASDLGASRAAVREALRFLAGDGLVELVPNRGCRIRRIDPRRLVEMTEVFNGVLWAALEKVALRIHENPVRVEIKKAADRIRRAYDHGSPRERAESIYEFNQVIFSLTGNPFFLEVVRKMRGKYFLTQSATYPFIYNENDAIHWEIAAEHLLSGRARESFETIRMRFDVITRQLLKSTQSLDFLV